MNRKQNLEILQSLDENTLARDIAIPLFGKGGYGFLCMDDTRVNKDWKTVLVSKEEFGELTYCTCLITKQRTNEKEGRSKQEKELVAEIKQIVEKGAPDGAGNTVRQINPVYILTPFDVLTEDKHLIQQQLQAWNVNIKFFDGIILIEKMQRYMPHFFFSLHAVQVLDEATLTKSIIIPLLERMTKKNVNYVHGADEAGRDVLFSVDTVFEQPLHYGAQIKVVPITGDGRDVKGNFMEIYTKARTALETPFNDQTDNTQKMIDVMVVITSKTVTGIAKSLLMTKLVKEAKRNIRFVDGETLAKWIDKFLVSEKG